jgi:Zinc-binding dehydrogenase
VSKPAEVWFADAAGVLFGGTTALYFLRDRARVRSGQSVLVNGASGAVGSSTVQLASHFGADVTAVTSAASADLVAAWGARQVVDHARTPAATLSGPYDIAFDAVGNVSRTEGFRLAAPGGLLILDVASLFDTVRARGRVIAGPAPERAADVAFLLDRGGRTPRPTHRGRWVGRTARGLPAHRLNVHLMFPACCGLVHTGGRDCLAGPAPLY